MDFSEDCKELSLYPLTMEVLYRACGKIRPQGISNFHQQPTHVFDEGEVSVSEQRLHDIVSQNNPLMIARFGSVELHAFVNYLQVTNQMKDTPSYSALRYLKDECFPKWYAISTRTCMSRQAGFFPCSDEMLTRWGDLVLKDIKELDVLLSWLGGEEYIDSYMGGY